MRNLRRLLSMILAISIMIVSVGYVGAEEEESSAEIQDTKVTLSVIEESDITEFQLVLDNETGTIWVDSDGMEESTREAAEGIESGNIDNVHTLIRTIVAEDLEDVGFICEPGVAQTIENENYTALWLFYRDANVNLFDDDSIQSVGFVEFVSEQEKFYDPSKEESLIVVNPLELESDQIFVCTYLYEEIPSRHFVYQNYYVSYYQQTPMRIVYSIQENTPNNYNMEFGSLYDFDKKRYLVDENILDEYQHHSAVPLFSEQDYKSLEQQLRKTAADQEKNGYIVSEYKVVYISPESIQAYLDSEEEATFFGFSVSALTEALGSDLALEFTGTELRPAETLKDLEDYEWKSVLTKIGIGAGIIIVGATLAPLTVGVSFSCALITICEIAIPGALIAGLSNLAMETATGVLDGEPIQEAIMNASYNGLNAFANQFVILSVVGSAGVVSGLIKPKACFIAGTPVIVRTSDGNYGYANIEDIHAGDFVLAYDESSGEINYQPVADTLSKEVIYTQKLVLAGETIITTPEHPFYSITANGWKQADELRIGEYVFCFDGSFAVVQANTLVKNNAAETVFNLIVDNSHTFFAGKCGALVHNECKTVDSMRQDAVDKAWKKEEEAVRKGTSKYNWTEAEKNELLTNHKIHGYEGHHIFTVKELQDTVNQKLIADPDDIVFVKREVHIWLHDWNTNNPTNIDKLVELFPWAAERVELLLGKMAA